MGAEAFGSWLRLMAGAWSRLVSVRLCPYLWGVAPAEGAGNGSLGPALAPVQSYRTAPTAVCSCHLAKQEYLLIKHMANPGGRGAWQLPEFPV